MFIITLTYKVPTEIVDQHLAAHSEFLKNQYAQGNFFLSGRKVPRTGGMIFAKVENRQVLDAILKCDPFNINKVADYEVTELQPTMTGSGLEFLLD
jgi:uncharacterized protein YciI